LFERKSTVFWWTSEFRSLCEFVEALKMGCGYDWIIRSFL